VFRSAGLGRVYKLQGLREFCNTKEKNRKSIKSSLEGVTRIFTDKFYFYVFSSNLM
jgi:hypothetical protein